MACVIEVVTLVRQGIEGREIARKKYLLNANENESSKIGRELRYHLNIMGLSTRNKEPTEAKPWHIIVTPKSKTIYFEWRFCTGDDAVVESSSFAAHEWRTTKGNKNGQT